MRSRILPEAQAEAHAAAVWYENQRDGLGTEFLDAFQVALNDLHTHPRRFPKHVRATQRRELRHYLLGHFPYQVIYEVRTVEIVIVAVAHFHREPGFWDRRKS